MSSQAKKKLKLSIVVPLMDLRTTSTRTMRSVLEQSMPRDEYEVIAVWPKDFTQKRANELGLLAALNQFDKHIKCAELGTYKNEILLYELGAAQASGELVFFIESHTPLYFDAVAHIVDYFFESPNEVAAWAPRNDLNTSMLDKLLALANEIQEKDAKQSGYFTFGANSVIKTEALKKIEIRPERYFRYAEAVIEHKIKKITPNIGKIRQPLSEHDNHLTLSKLVDINFHIG